MTDTASSRARAVAWGNELMKAHGKLRELLATARTQVEERVNGQAGSRPAERAAPALDEQLRRHCLTACEYLHGHHHAEDGVILPHLEREFPALAPVMTRLREEHVVVARLAGEIEALAAEDAAGDAEHVRVEIDRLTTELEAHFAYEEAQIVPVLNSLTGPVPWAESGEKEGGDADASD